jgi:hypothetical protein
MCETLLLIKINSLPNNLKKELIDFLDFLIAKKNIQKTENHPRAGCLKGVFKMRDDFDEPLEDFNEYM